MTMVKTYRRADDGTLHYREAWDDAGTFVVHEGKVGTKGATTRSVIRGRAQHRRDLPTASEYRRAFDERAAADGYRTVPDEEHGWVVLQCWTHSPGLDHPDDERLFEDGQDALDQFLGWRGVGALDGNDVGGTPPTDAGVEGTILNLFCVVVDTTIGVATVRRFAKAFELTQPYVVGVREPGADSPYTLAWSPRRSRASFELMGY